ncbi:hypothetical protein SBV1_140039 [Verrucomicrobia bacterium]|nr:hypothetical protein SBV1_140039 [Verrucomicrobiota bacterium]
MNETIRGGKRLAGVSGVLGVRKRQPRKLSGLIFSRNSAC